jgi:hypothetical protein
MLTFTKQINQAIPSVVSYITQEQITLGSITAIYRNIRENYEFRLRYDEAGKFFIREMELKRKYREAPSVSAVFKLKLTKSLKKLKLVNINAPEPKIESELRQNWWPRRNLSLTFILSFSTYGESIVKPILIGIIIVALSTLFWAIQNDPSAEPSLSVITNDKLPLSKTVSNFINVTQVSNNTHILKAFERSLSDLLPLLAPPNSIKVGVIDFIVKIVGGTLTFVLLGIALRRKFERKYTR